MIRILHGDCAQVLKTLEDNSVDSIVTDPPYGLSFMGKKWDYDVPSVEVWAECLRVLKPGGHLLCFAGTRTQHRMAFRIEDAGFEIRDMLAWLYGSGFPKSLDVSKAIDKVAPRRWMFADFAAHYAARRAAAGLTHAAICEAGGFYAEHNHGGASVNWEKGHNVPTLAQWRVIQPLLGLSDEWFPLIEREEAERAKVGQFTGRELVYAPGSGEAGDEKVIDITAPATEAARQWQGWGTALKPALEPITLARKPLQGTVAGNVLKHGTGALNIDGCRAATDEPVLCQHGTKGGDIGFTAGGSGGYQAGDGRQYQNLGRWPANVLHDGSEEVLAAFPQQGDGRQFGEREAWGSAARFFYTAKASRFDRNDGLRGMPETRAKAYEGGEIASGKTPDSLGGRRTAQNHHPTVKPTDLMRYLCRLVTPPGGLVLDPFMGSGSTLKAAELEGFSAIGVELSAEYVEIARRRIASDAPLFANVEAA